MTDKEEKQIGNAFAVSVEAERTEDATPGNQNDNSGSAPSLTAGVGRPPTEAPPSTLEDDDDWSRKVETDEVLPASMTGPSSRNPDELPAHAITIDGVHEERPILRPTEPPRTMKEKLVQRERERRIETERARLKRQFALSNNRNEGGATEEREGMEEDVLPDIVPGRADSVATLGEESTMVHPDEESAERERIGFNMERFLRNSDSFNPQLEPTDEDQPTNATESGGVLMERFLNEDPVVVGAVGPPDTTTPINPMLADSQRSVSFDVGAANAGPGPQRVLTVPPSDGSIEANASSIQGEGHEHPSAIIDDLDNIASDDETPVALHEMPPSAQEEEPRVLFLTRADIEEMAAAEEASIANAPPSERDDNLSEVGELADFQPNPLHRGDFSDTPTGTTAMDSVSLHGSEKPPSAMSSDRHSVDGAGSANDTVTAQPPSEKDILSPMRDIETVRPVVELSEEVKQPPLCADDLEEGKIGHNDEDIVNRRIRPGMAGLMANANNRTSAPATAAEESAAAAIVDDFDFDKEDDAKSVTAEMNDSFQNLPDDHHGWGDAEDSDRVGAPAINSSSLMVNGSGYGAMEEGQPSNERGSSSMTSRNMLRDETAPLLGDVPPEIITRRQKSDGTRRESSTVLSLNLRLNSIFSDVRSDEEGEKAVIHNESRQYLDSSAFTRAAPERMFALTITLLLEIPVLLMISGGSDALCELVGRRRYQLLVSFIPLTSAISGNVGLQASTLTTRAISHEHVTEGNFMLWLGKEMGAACYLGVGMGCLLGFIAYMASGMDIAFGITILIAQFVSIVTAGCTGTLAPLLFSFIFKRDSGKWGGPLETAVQDIVGSFAMVVISYRILLWLGPGPIDPSDVCGPTSGEDLA